MPAAFDFVEDTAEKSFDFQADPIPTPEPAPTISPTAQLAKARLAFAPLAGQAVANLPDKPLITLPEWPKGEGSLEEQITGQVYGKLKDFLGFMTSPKGVAVTGAAIAAPEVAGPIISATMLPAAVEEGIGTVKSIGKGDIPGAAGHATGLALTGAGVLGGVAQFLPRTVAEAKVPVKVAKSPAPGTHRTRTGAVTIERSDIPTPSRVPTKEAIPIQSETSFTPLTPQEEAALKAQAEPEPLSQAEVDRLFLDKLNEESNREIEAATAPKPAPLTPAEQAEARADLAAEIGEEPQAPVAPEPAPAPETPPAIIAPEAKAPEPVKPKTVDQELQEMSFRYDEYARPYEGGQGLPAGAEGLQYRWKADAVREFRDALKRGETPEQAEATAKAKSREWIARHNARRPKDIEWKRWEGSADDAIENARRVASRGATEPTPAAKVEAPAAKPDAETAPVAAAAKVEQQVKAVAKTEGQKSAKEVKSELVDRLERAIDTAPSESEVQAKSYTTANMKRVDIPDQAEIVTIEIPGDGTFKIRNTKEALSQILKRAKKIATTSSEPTKISKKAIESSERALSEAAKSKEAEAVKNIKVTQEKARGELYDAINKSEDEGIAGSSKPQEDPELYPEGTMWKEWRIRKATPEERTEHWKGTKAEIRWVGERRTVKFSKAKGRTEGEWLFDDSGKTRADVVRGMEDNMPGDASIQDEGLKAWRDLENMEGRYGWLKEGKPKPPETPPTGPGMAAQPASPEARLSQSLQSVPKQKPPPQGPAAQPLGVTPFPGLVTGLQKVAQSAQRVWHEIADVPKFAPFKRVINKFNGDTQRTSLKIRQMQADIESRVPDPKRLEAITNWLQADGDVAKLQAWESASKNVKTRLGYRDAQRLTPYEVQVAKAIRQYYDDLLARGQAYGILDQAKDDYVTQIWKRPLLGGAQFAQFASKLSRTFKFGMKSVFENFFEGEQAGYKPVTKNISKLLGVYVAELEKTIATRDMIRDLTHETASDGNPLAKVEGTAHIGQDAAGDPTGPMFVRPGVVKGDVRYAELNHPALKNWKWISKDPESGRDVFILGELRVHPEIRRHLANVLSQSQIRKWMREPSESELANIVKLAARFGDTTSKVVKQTMLGTLSTFHHVQEGTHGIGHRANAFLPPKLPVGTPELNYALDHGLQLAGEGAALENFREGLGSHGVFDKVPVIGKWIEKHNDLLFNEYIPRLKWDTWQRINRRNLARYQKEIASGEVTADDVAYLSSKQTNAAFGHQNYTDLGRNATVQHVLRLFALAPDFLEARTRFAGQAAQGLLSKVGREQLEALSLLGGLFYVGARIGNKLSDDDYHWEEPFRVKYGNRWYGMRSVPEDLWRAFNDTRVFAYNRLNPVFGRPTMELLSGVNYRGEKIPASEVFKNILVSGIPIQMREFPAFRSLTETQRNTTIGAWEQFLSSVGVQVSRYSPLNQTYKLATKWRKAQGEKEAPTTYPVSKYQPLRYALEDHDLTRAADELAKLTEGGKVPLTKIAQGFRVSLHRPFSGSLANEGKFVASLTPDQKALYKEAIAQRSRVWREFTNAEQEYHNRLKEGR